LLLALILTLIVHRSHNRWKVNTSAANKIQDTSPVDERKENAISKICGLGGNIQEEGNHLVQNKRTAVANEESIESRTVRLFHTRHSVAGHATAGDFHAIRS
jgi:hypothetical protein